MISQNVGLAYVISSVEQRHQVKLLDLTFQFKKYREYIITELERAKPDLVGLSVTNFSFQVSLEIGKLIKQIYPEVHIMWGGGYPTLFPEESINNSSIDAICIGEGEKSVLEYLDKLERGKEPKVEGIWYKDRKGHIHKNRLRPFEENIDDLPFPNWDHWNIERHLQTNLYFLPGAIKFLSSRGCPYNCSFCSNEAIMKAIPGRYHRERTAESIIKEIKINEDKYWKKGFRTIHFADEIFGLNYELLQDFCKQFRSEGLDEKFSWCCATRPDIITKNWARIVANAGCAWVWLGIESGDEYIRNEVYKKNITREQIIKATSYLRDNGIAYSFSMMIGCPEDTKETIKKGIKLVKELGPVTADFSFYQPLPKTKLGSKILRTNEVKDIKSMRQWNIPRMRTQSLDIGDLNKIMWRIRLTRLYRFFKFGLMTKKLVFILDIIKYIFSVNRCRSISLTNPIIALDIELKTIFKYILYRRKEQHIKEKYEE